MAEEQGTGKKKSATKVRQAAQKKPAAESGQRTRKGKEISYVVGIGASAGGIEAISTFMEALPGETGMAYILVQHLDPTHESMLSEIIGRRAAVPVKEARHGMKIEPDNLYVIPPNRYMGIADGKLTLVSRDSGRGKFMPIDYMLESLADQWQNRAMGIILSGTANDGTAGLKAIKAEGGVTFAQDDASARYPEMPRNAINAGAVDFVLPPARIAQELARIGKYPLIVVEENKVPQILAQVSPQGTDDLSTIFRILRASTGIDFSNYKLNTIQRRITRRMLVTKVESIPQYLDYLKSHPEEPEILANDLLINVTSFFRDCDTFDGLKERILPELVKQKPNGSSLRVWVPGCSTGEEAYSLAMCLLEVLTEIPHRIPIQIFATDISENIVERARSGIYSESIANEVSKERLARFFIKVEGGYQISKNIRDLCIFARQDLSKDPPFSRMDLISCRNVLIYLAPVLQKKIISTFHYALNPDGVLVLGTSETIGGFADYFSLIDKKLKIYQKKQVPYRANHDFQIAGYEERAGLIKKHVHQLPPQFDVQKEADRILLGGYAPASVLINDQMDILQFRGKTGSYIEPVSGTASLSLAKMLHEGLLLEVRALLIQSRKQDLPVQKNDIEVHARDKKFHVDIDVVPVRSPDTKKPHFFLVVFRESQTGEATPREPVRAIDRRRDQRQNDQLRQELQATREYLQSTLEEKESMNEEFSAAVEEIQSSNEELQSTNEELETAKEELQSTNEELITVNEELQNRNIELSQVNNDLLNLLNNVSFPVVMLTTDLRIRRFTPMAEKTLGLIPSDVGRPLSDLRLSIMFPNLEELMLGVVESLEAREREVQDQDGRWFLLRVRPYLTLEKQIDGVVMTLLEISEMKSTVLLAQQFAAEIIGAVNQPLLVLDTRLRVEMANQAFYTMMKATSADIDGQYIYDMQGARWNDPQLRMLLENVLPKQADFESFTLDLNLPGQETQHILLSGRRLKCARGEAKVLVAVEQLKAV